MLEGAAARDIEVAVDGSVLVSYPLANSLVRFTDLDGDGTFTGDGEMKVVFDADEAFPDAATRPTQMLAIASAPAKP